MVSITVKAGMVVPVVAGAIVEIVTPVAKAVVMVGIAVVRVKAQAQESSGQ